MNWRLISCTSLVPWALAPSLLGAAEPPAPAITSLAITNAQKTLTWTPYPSAQQYKIFSTTNLNTPFAEDTSGDVAGNVWRATNNSPARFHKLQVTPMASNSLLTAIVLNRLAYGPTPDELTRLAGIGPQAYVDEQLAPWSINEDVSSQNANVPLIEAKFVAPTNLVTSTTSSCNLSEFRAWHCLRAIAARRQLLEILLQFYENHFVTAYSKTFDYFAQYYTDTLLKIRVSAQTEYLENQKWRAALLNPACAFYDLLKISAESPAMIIYLDTVASKGNSSNIANENYARELLELFTMGVDNGYDQNDITVMSRCWTGWSVEKVATNDAFNPFAAAVPGNKGTNIGVWAFNYKPVNHNTNSKTLFPGKTIPARFGLPWTANVYGTNPAGSYQLVVPGHNNSDTNGISEGYQVIQHLANLPFTEEYISIKLCRLLVHDNFPNPSNDPSNSVFSVYNYAAGNLSPEADLVHRCMLAWETNSPKGQIWKVLKTIVDSDVFRSQSAAAQKVKTPLEYTVSAVRALRSGTNGSFTSDSDGFSFAGTNTADLSPLKVMGQMLLFDRDSPDGYPETGPPWISAGTLAERIRFVQSFCLAAGQDGHKGWQGGGTNDAGNNTCNIVGLLTAKLSSTTWTNAPALADYFLGLLYPGEGTANLNLYRNLAVGFLNQNDNEASSPFNLLTVSGMPGTTYDTRVRGMVGMLMSLQRFQEQ